MEHESVSSHHCPYQAKVDKLSGIDSDTSIEKKSLPPFILTLLLEGCLLIIPNFCITLGDSSAEEVIEGFTEARSRGV
jgi:hypothetical protein